MTKKRVGRGRGGRIIRPGFDPSRRQFLAGLAGATGALVLPGCESGDRLGGANSSLPNPADSGIDHIVVLMMENRSFDHYLGWLPGADGRQAGLSYKDEAGTSHETYPLAPEYQGCAFKDPDHSHEGGMVQLNGGRNDGFLKGRDIGDTFSVGYYTEADLPFTGAAARAWTVYDRYFTSIMAETYPNRFYQHAAQTWQIHNNIQDAFTNPATLPTIWDLLAEAGLTGTYYYSDLPFVGLWGPKYMDNGTAQPFSKFLTDAAGGFLPAVSFVDPVFSADSDTGQSRDDHPFADIRNGQIFLNQVYDAVVGSPQWANTALFINYDEWGGFFDHVTPPDAGVIPDADIAACEREGVAPFSQMGFRVPTLAISPFARRGFVSHDVYDHCSILKMIEWRFGLPALTARDARANNIAASLDFTNPPNLDAPAFSVPAGPFGAVCPEASPVSASAAAARQKHMEEMRQMRELAMHYGFPVPR
jgi:phospholipase C